MKVGYISSGNFFSYICSFPINIKSDIAVTGRWQDEGLDEDWVAFKAKKTGKVEVTLKVDSDERFFVFNKATGIRSDVDYIETQVSGGTTFKGTIKVKKGETYVIGVTDTQGNYTLKAKYKK